MAIIIETCPKCGHDLTDLMIATYPPIPQKKCFGCGWSWEGKREEIIRVPFGGNSLDIDNKYALNGSLYDECINVNHDDDSCMVNNLNGCVYKVNAIDLEGLNSVNKIDINAAIDEILKYLDKTE